MLETKIIIIELWSIETRQPYMYQSLRNERNHSNPDFFTVSCNLNQRGLGVLFRRWWDYKKNIHINVVYDMSPSICHIMPFVHFRPSKLRYYWQIHKHIACFSFHMHNHDNNNIVLIVGNGKIVCFEWATAAAATVCDHLVVPIHSSPHTHTHIFIWCQPFSLLVGPFNWLCFFFFRAYAYAFCVFLPLSKICLLKIDIHRKF